MRKFAWYGRLSTKDKQDPTISFPSQRSECAEKAEELGGRIVCDFTDQEAGRRDDRVGWSELIREAKEPDARRFDAVIVYSTSRLSRELFHALAYERELARAGVEVFYARSAGDQTSPEGRLIRHMFQALDQFEVEKLGREVRRGQTENTKQGYRNGGRAPYGYRLRHEPHPDPRRAKAGDQKSRLVADPEQAPVIAEMFALFLAGSGYKEIADRLNRPGGPPPPRHVDSKRNTSGKWSKSTIRAILENHVYTGRLYWGRLDFRAVKQGEGPLVRRSPEDWIEAEQRHEALVSEEDFERVQVEMKARSAGQGDTAAEATGHGKWQYVREDSLLTLIDAFFATRVFGPDRLAHFRKQSSTLAAEQESRDGAERTRAVRRLGEVDQRIERQLGAIEAGVDPALVGERIRELKAEREEIEAAIAQLDQAQRNGEGFDVEEAPAVLDSLPDLSKPLAEADPELRRSVFEAFRLRVEIDRNAGLIRLKALVSSAFSQAKDLSDVCATTAIAGVGIEPTTFGL